MRQLKFKIRIFAKLKILTRLKILAQLPILNQIKILAQLKKIYTFQNSAQLTFWLNKKKPLAQLMNILG